ncbi:hypothetical protein ATM17_03505 [Sphingopyxis macrogoltabida]|uniref:Uncharacterized protein n=1 Tax=Sphingopyxis macrogoltabida TaxID=33050 RepID=A0AAC8YXZ3_SPHMC|nr:hypothetical protein LH19_03540 [Sphingopyxis macrogoltabida]AMU88117.1 hypothetical protein ATM17_03505 [Sphingopyxis macrogoltabida]
MEALKPVDGKGGYAESIILFCNRMAVDYSVSAKPARYGPAQQLIVELINVGWLRNTGRTSPKFILIAQV